MRGMIFGVIYNEKSEFLIIVYIRFNFLKKKGKERNKEIKTHEHHTPNFYWRKK